MYSLLSFVLIIYSSITSGSIDQGNKKLVDIDMPANIANINTIHIGSVKYNNVNKNGISRLMPIAYVNRFPNLFIIKFHIGNDNAHEISNTIIIY
jgi:hypothetical protein